MSEFFFLFLTFLGIKSLAEYCWRNFKNPLISLKFYLSEFFKIEQKIDFIEKYGKWAVITGASDGIGKQYSIELAKKGLNVFLISRTQSKLEKLSKEIANEFDVKVKYLVIDFSKGREVYDEIKKELKNIEIGILVNNVGMATECPEPFDEHSEDFIWDIINVNAAACPIMTKIVLDGMKNRKKGAIINMSSLSHFLPIPYISMYSALKSYIQSLTISLQYELSEYNIDVQCVFPCVVSTNITKFLDILHNSNNCIPIDVVSFSKEAVSTIGKLSATTGCFKHGVQVALFKLFPVELETFIAFKCARWLRQRFFQDHKVL